MIGDNTEVPKKIKEGQVDLLDGTAFDPSPSQILADIDAALAEYSIGNVYEVESADDLL